MLPALLDIIVDLVDIAALSLLAYGAFLVLGGGGFHRDAPEDAALPHLDLRAEP